jgi:hypothetical protein
MNDTLTRFVTRQGKRIEVETKPTRVPTKTRDREDQYFKMPMRWLRKLSTRPRANSATWCIACHLLRLNYEHHGLPFKLSNGVLKYTGIDRHVKYRVLSELEKLGLIAVDRRIRKSPIISIYD